MANKCESTATLCYNCGQWGHMAKSCLDKGKEKQGMGENKGEHKGKEKGKVGKGRWDARREREREREREKGLQSMNEWDEWDQTVQPEIEPPNPKTTSAKWQVPMERGKRQFVCNTKFEAIAE